MIVIHIVNARFFVLYFIQLEGATTFHYAAGSTSKRVDKLRFPIERGADVLYSLYKLCSVYECPESARKVGVTLMLHIGAISSECKNRKENKCGVSTTEP